MQFDWDEANAKHLWERHHLLPETIEEAMLTLRRVYKLQIVNDEPRTVYLAGSAARGVFTVKRKERAFFKEEK